ncbi:MAG: hypothetical protein H0V89_01870 [Deltaproteobacteria bacterium]|nr:hypothetical protein [Deltaproteobacteria bacterium]
MSALGDALRSIATALGSVQAAWYVFGAQAVAVRGAPRSTQDLDVTVRVDRGGRAALMTALGAAGLRPRYPDLAEALLAAGAVIPLVHHATGFEVDLVLAGSGLEDLALSRATIELLDGVSVPVATATDLAVMKTLAGRGKDLDDLRALLAGGTVDAAEVRDLLGQLEEALGQSDLLPAFESAVRDTEG